MSTAQATSDRNPHPGSGLPPPRYQVLINFYSAIDKYLIRWLSFSIVSWGVMNCNGCKTIPALILYTKGRKTGRRIDVPIIYFRDAENYIVVGSVGGAPKHPSWFLNMQAEPNCEIRVAYRLIKVRARETVSEERERIWNNIICKAYPYFADYAVNAHPRRIPVVSLEPR